MIMGLNFESITGTDKTISEIFPYADGMTKGNATSSADQIQIMREDGGYNTYFLCNGKAGKATVTDGDGKWVKNGATSITSDTITNGTAFWYVSKAFLDNPETTPYNITVSGQVLSAAFAERDIAMTYTMIASPYPCDIPLNDGVMVSEGATKGNATSSADQIQIMREDGGYNTYFLCNGKAGKATIADGDGKWVKNGTTVVSTDSFPAGGGAWFVSVTADAKVKFTGPNMKTEE